MATASPLPSGPGKLFEARKKVHPKAVDGTFRRVKWAVMVFCLIVYYATPWLRWDRGPYAPDQAVLIDLPHRRFYMFSIEIWPHEFYYVVGLLVMAAIGLFLVTSAVGRAWCGYACPQTVWTDLFVHVERLIEGDRNAQIKLDRARWGSEKILKRGTKHLLYLLISIATGGAWIFYFADAPTLAGQLWHWNAPFAAYATIGILTFTTYVLGNILREQFCIYACPWPRIQSAMLDDKSLMVTYKYWRGEPRTHGLKRAGPAQRRPENLDQGAAPQPGVPSLVALAADPMHSAKIGDCIDCNACVAVCPTGIDIRNGSQVGCITCGLCIDACDQVMERIGRPPRLIGYSTVADELLAGEGKEPVPPLKRLFRVRTIAYFLLWGAVGLAMLFALGLRSRIDVAVSQNRNPTYVQLSDGSVRNNYTLRIRNMENRPRAMEVSIEGLPGAVIWSEDRARDTAGRAVRVTVPADEVATVPLFVAAPGEGEAHTPIGVSVRALDEEGGAKTDRSYFERPGGGG